MHGKKGKKKMNSNKKGSHHPFVVALLILDKEYMHFCFAGSGLVINYGGPELDDPEIGSHLGL